MHEHEARLEKLRAEQPQAPKKSSRSLRLHGAALAGGPVRSGEIVVRLEDLAVGYLPGRGALAPDGSDAAEPVIVARAPFLAAQRGERIGIVGPNGAGKTTLLRTIAGDLPPLDGIVAFGHQVQPGLPRPAARRGDPRRDGPRRDPRGDPGHARRGARLPRPVPVPRRRRVQGGPLAVGRRAVAPGARAARDPAVEPAAARRAHEPPRHRGPRGDRGVPRRVAGDDPARLARPAAARDDLRPAVGRRRRRSRSRSTAGIGRGARRWPTAGPWRPRPRRRANRGRPGCPGRQRRQRRTPHGHGRRPTPRARGPAVDRRGRGTARRPPRPKRRSCPRRPTDAGREALDAELSRLGLRK